MKITDFALVFIAIILPFMLVLYINVTFTIKAEEMEMYYQNVIEAALDDAAYEMKQVESQDKAIDFGYSDKNNKKINVNAQVGVDSFFDSLYRTLEVKGNEAAEQYLNIFVPAVAVVEYDGVRISKNENVMDGGFSATKRVLKPKRYFTYTYSIVRNGGEYTQVAGVQSTNVVSVHTIEFTMDTYITHRGYDYTINKEIEAESFYYDDVANNKNNKKLVAGVAGEEAQKSLINEITSSFSDLRKSVISNTVSEELAYAVNANNFYAKQAGVVYSFNFPATSEEDMYNMIDGVGIIAFVQGLSVGNKFLNTKAFGMSSLGTTNRYYYTAPNEDSQIQMNLYHKDTKCPEYKLSRISDMSPRYATSRQEAATAKTTGTVNGEKKTLTGFYPCPICNP